MTKLWRTPAPLYLLTATVLIATATGLASLWPLTIQAAKHQSSQLTTQAATASRGEAEVNYRLAVHLDPTNTAARLGLARYQIDAGRPDDALTTLSKAGEGSEVERLKVRTLLELGRYNQAADEAIRLTTPGHPEPDYLLAASAYALASRTSDLASLAPFLGSPGAVQSLSRIQAGHQPLAAELYTSGLLQSSSALLVKEPVSYSRNLLLARIRCARPTPTTLDQAADLLVTATHLNPAGLEARQLLAQVYRDQKKSALAAEQDILIARLQTGRP